MFFETMQIFLLPVSHESPFISGEVFSRTEIWPSAIFIKVGVFCTTISVEDLFDVTPLTAEPVVGWTANES